MSSSAPLVTRVLFAVLVALVTAAYHVWWTDEASKNDPHPEGQRAPPDA